MKAVFAVVALLVAGSAVADEYVQGYVKSNGTYVQPHMRSSPNSVKFDNYSSHGNSNPYTGQKGHDRNEFTNPPVYNTNQYGNNNSSNQDNE